MPRSKTTSIPRPAGVVSSDEGRSRLGDFSRPIPIDKRITRRPRIVAVTGLLGLAVVTTIIVAVFVLPISTWRDQDVDIEQRQAQLDELLRVNGELASETSRLDTAGGIREAAREDFGFVEVGEQRATIMAMPPLPTDLPAGWPYNVVSQIMDAQAIGTPPPAPAPIVTTED